MRTLISIIILGLLCSPAWGRSTTVVVGQGTAAATVISDCSGPMSYTGSTGCSKRETFEGTTDCYGGFDPHNCDNAWYYAANAVDFSSTAAPIYGTNSMLVTGGASNNKAILDFTAAGTIYVGMAFQLGDLPNKDHDVVTIMNSSEVAKCIGYINFNNKVGAWNAGGSNNTTETATLSADTTYYMLVRATKGTGADAICTTYLSTDGTTWGYSATSTNGTWTDDVSWVYYNGGGDVGEDRLIDDIRISTSTLNFW